MSGAANVHSVAAIEGFRTALAEFELRTQAALDSLTAELRRVSDWLDNEGPAYWQQQEKLASDDVQQAKLDLERCLMFPIAGEQPACREERATLKVAQQRLDYCHAKRTLVRNWRGMFQHEAFEFQGRIGQLRRILETDLPAARAKLQLIVRRVEGYTIEAPPSRAEEEHLQQEHRTSPE